jgi:hypothetical protein
MNDKNENPLKLTLMTRDGLTDKEASKKIDEAWSVFMEYIDKEDMNSAFNICEEMFGLEPDYLLDFIEYFT